MTRFIKKLSPTGDRQQMAVPKEVSAAWNYPTKVEVVFKGGVLTLTPLVDGD